jgi:hypothetical protein
MVILLCESKPMAMTIRGTRSGMIYELSMEASRPARTIPIVCLGIVAFGGGASFTIQTLVTRGLN